MNELVNTLRDSLEIPALRAAAVVAGAIVAAWIVRLLVIGALRALTRRTKTTFDDRLLAVLRRPIFVSVVVAGLHVAAGVLEMPEAYTVTTRRILGTLLVLIWTVTAFRVCHVMLEGLGRLADRVRWIEARTVPLFDNRATILLAGLALYALLVTWNLDVKPWLASAGIVGLAVGFAAKDTLANLFGGLFILADAPFTLGDYIVLDTGERGKVTRIGLRSSRILTRDDVEITLPNAQVANSKIVNESGGPWVKYRVTVNVGVAYGSDVDAVRRILLEATEGVDDVVPEPAPRVRFTSFGDSSLDFRLLCWVSEPEQRGRALDALNTSVYKAFAREGIEIPFPQRVVHLPVRPEAT